ncbi:hypothetical protein B0H17DRAFT_1200393 [Mycena rosella]|uniref:Uncharacterized protein n=1 Tax=Mycena rosella TaxID=1033263 RepID=A0AAD7DLT1_MYCRO|nr:hypothetical protein B0H17DRAFT_1200393 [Mycena rosella]
MHTRTLLASALLLAGLASAAPYALETGSAFPATPGLTHAIPGGQGCRDVPDACRGIPEQLLARCAKTFGVQMN